MDCTRRHALATLGSMALPLQARASAWPSQSIKMVLGYSAGGGADTIARALAPEIQKVLGQPLVMDYRPGAGGVIAAAAVARAPSDGHTVLLADTGNMAILPSLRKVPYDPLRDFTPLSWVGGSNLILLTNPQLPVHDVPSLVQLLKAHPDRYVYGSSGVGTPTHLAAELFKQMTQTQIRHVPYKGASQGLTDLMSGIVHLVFASLPPAQSLMQAGRLRAIASTGTKRVLSLPQLPTVAEQGVAGYEAAIWFAVVGPSALPKAIASRLQMAFKAAVSDKELVASFEKLGGEGFVPRPAAYIDQAVRNDLAKWGQVIRSAKIQLDE